MSRPRFARRVRGHGALTLAFAPRLIIQPFRGYHIFQQNPRGHFDTFEFLHGIIAAAQFHRGSVTVRARKSEAKENVRFASEDSHLASLTATQDPRKKIHVVRLPNAH